MALSASQALSSSKPSMKINKVSIVKLTAAVMVLEKIHVLALKLSFSV